MSQGLEEILEEILEDQKRDLSPHDGALHRKLQESTIRANMLRACVKDVLGGNCSAALPSPKMPKQYFSRKQWSRTLLETATDYIAWLEQKLRSLLTKVTEKLTEAKSRNELNGI